MVLRVLRFTGSERAVHWLTAAAFVSLLASGLPVGRSGSFHNLMYGWHLISAGALVGGILLGIAAGNRRALGGAASELVRLTADDRSWLAHAPAHLLAGDPEPPTPVRLVSANQKEVIVQIGAGAEARRVSFRAAGPLARTVGTVHGRSRKLAEEIRVAAQYSREPRRPSR